MMTDTWRRKLVDRYRDVFVRSASGEATIIGYPYVGDGWSAILEVMVERIAAFAPQGSHRIDRIEEKNGSLVVGVQRLTAGLDDETLVAVDEAVALAEARSACTCQVCGAEGALRDDGGWLATLCKDHARGEPVPVRPGWKNLEILHVVVGGRLRVSRARRYDRLSDSFVEVDLSDIGDIA